MNVEDKEKKVVEDLIENAIEKWEPYDTFSFLQGFEAACELFGIWKDGEQYLGIGRFTFKDIKSGIEKYTKEQK